MNQTTEILSYKNIDGTDDFYRRYKISRRAHGAYKFSYVVSNEIDKGFYLRQVDYGQNIEYNNIVTNAEQ